MRFFGYYALHSFLNQLKKLFKTWVLIFFAVCLLLGVGIGIFAASLEDTIEETRETEGVIQMEDGDQLEEAAPEEEPEEGYSLAISPMELMELIAGGVVLAVFFFEAVGADKNGSKIFLPADVNLLFPSPMKPQSVLMFRLATQLGTALIGTIYLVFQLPNLMLNLGLSGWAATAILVTWFSTILSGKLLQVMLYTICSTHSRFKQLLRKGIYAFGILIAGSFFLFFKASGADILTAASRFFNAPVTRWIPFWGWLKGMTVNVAQTNWALACLDLLLLILGCAVFAYAIWHINADFYEDAMAKSEETAAMMEKVYSEKTSGTAVTRRRKKDRKDSLRRDGLNRGSGASIFFFKTMYNRFRFAHFGFLTKTMETYFVAALGIAAVLRFYFNSDSAAPVAMVLGVLVFFRALGNPLAEDTGMDFFRMIPDSTWRKLFFSLLGGTVNCLLDLFLPTLAACALLAVNPLRLLVWLPLIVSLDFYAGSVVAFIDLSVPASIGKTIKQVITILFIYFGLLPDIGVLAFGIVLGHTVSAAIGSTLINLALAVTAFSLASVFLQPKGKPYAAAQTQQDFKTAKRCFSRIGFGFLMIPLVTSVLQAVLLYVVDVNYPLLLDNPTVFWLITAAPQYLVAMPLCMLILRRIPAEAPEKHRLSASQKVKFFFISVFAISAGLLFSAVTALLAQGLIGSAPTNTLETVLSADNPLAQVAVIAILAPVFEELIFRKQFIDRMGRYGGKTAVVLSAMLFALCHGNFFQFFYAFGLGLIFGYIYLNTGKLRYTIVAHTCINFIGSVLVPAAVSHMSKDLQSVQILDPWTAVYGCYLLLLVFGGIVGLVLLCMNAGNLRYPAGSLELPKGKRFKVTCLNPGMALALVICILLMLASLFV